MSADAYPCNEPSRGVGPFPAAAAALGAGVLASAITTSPPPCCPPSAAVGTSGAGVLCSFCTAFMSFCCALTVVAGSCMHWIAAARAVRRACACCQRFLASLPSCCRCLGSVRLSRSSHTHRDFGVVSSNSLQGAAVAGLGLEMMIQRVQSRCASSIHKCPSHQCTCVHIHLHAVSSP